MDATGIKGSAKIKVLESMKGVDPKEWDEVALATTGVEKMNPFMSWAFLNAVEESRSAHPSTGWQPRHVVAYDSESGSLIGAVPLYLKSHSYGEYVFDNSWARAYGSITREPYYPKLQSCVPFSPVTGPRLLVRGETEEEQEWIRSALAQAVCQLVDTMGVSSAHVTFPAKREWELMGEQKWVQRTGIQYHWNNQGWQTFDDFLAALKQSKRKNIRSERSKVSKQGVKVHRLTGSAIEEKHWDAFYKFYTNTVDEHWGQAYLTRSFFSLLSRDMADNVLLIMAEEESTGEWVAGALNLVGGDCIYGRNWGCTKQFNSLHFELCYYQAIDAAIEMKKDRVEAGAQGEHKITRGYLPTLTFSAHWMRDTNFRRELQAAMNREREQVVYTTAMLTVQNSPYKEPPHAHLRSQGIIIQEAPDDEDEDSEETDSFP